MLYWTRATPNTLCYTIVKTSLTHCISPPSSIRVTITSTRTAHVLFHAKIHIAVSLIFFTQNNLINESCRSKNSSNRARQGGGVRETFVVRKISFGTGVERRFPLHSPVIDSIKVVRKGRVRRAKLYYLRNLRGKAARIVERRDNSEK